MAKAKKLWNISTGILGLPNGAQIGPGESAELGEFAENAGVSAWVAEGLASLDGAAKVTIIQSDGEAALQAKIDFLEAQVTDLTAQLDAATKPKE